MKKLVLIFMLFGLLVSVSNAQTDKVIKKNQEKIIIPAGALSIDKESEIYRVVENMPRFSGCDTGTRKERKVCSDKTMLEFIYKNIKYPKLARQNGVEGTCVVGFVIRKDGSIVDAKVVREIGGDCGEEALRVVKMMPNWIPGRQRGKAVSVQFNLPVKFKLTKNFGKVIKGQKNVNNIPPPPPPSAPPSPPSAQEPPQPPPPPPAPVREPYEIFKVVEDMPKFSGCDRGTKSEKKKCSDIKVKEFIYGNLIYPEIAKKNGIEGTCVISFVVDKYGKVINAKVVRNIGGECGKEALRVVKMMPNWVPGKQRGKAVAVQFNLPVKFKL